jgi:hypothetical protein
VQQSLCLGCWVFKRVLAPEKERAKKKEREEKRKKKVKGIELLFSCIPRCLGV